MLLRRASLCQTVVRQCWHDMGAPMPAEGQRTRHASHTLQPRKHKMCIPLQANFLATPAAGGSGSPPPVATNQLLRSLQQP